MPTFRRTFPGQPDEISRARHFTYHYLRHTPAVAEVCLMVSEVTTNAVQHSRSGQPGGEFTLTLTMEDTGVRVEVEDEGSTFGAVPHVENAEPSEAEHGRGLAVVEALADKYGSGRPNVVWFELSWSAGAW